MLAYAKHRRARVKHDAHSFDIDHEGKEVKFYDDLVKDKIVVINFMFATCQGT